MSPLNFGLFPSMAAEPSGQQAAQDFNLSLVHNVSHEIRTPLTIILGYAGLLNSEDLGSLAPEQREATRAILASSATLWALVERIGALLTTETHTSVTLPVGLAAIVTKVIARRRAAANDRGLSLDVHLAADLPLISGDPYLLEQAVDCLVDNAIKFTGRGGQVTVEVYATGEWVCAAVSDTGIGIPPDKMAHIFTPFYQVDGSATRRYSGIGLGLTLVERVVHEHLGEVEATSQPNQGSRFTIKLPVTGRVNTNSH